MMWKCSLVLLITLVLLPYCAQAQSWEYCNCTKCFTQSGTSPLEVAMNIVSTNTCTQAVSCATPQVNNSVTSCWNSGRTGVCDKLCDANMVNPNDNLPWLVYSMGTYYAEYPLNYQHIPNVAGSLGCSITTSCPQKRSVEEAEAEEEVEAEEEEQEKEPENDLEERRTASGSAAPEEFIYTSYQPRTVGCFSTASALATRNTDPTLTSINAGTCGASCSLQGWSYAGVTMVGGAPECYCASQTTGSMVSSSLCTTPCSSGSSYQCGGNGYIFVTANVDGFRVCSTMPGSGTNSVSTSSRTEVACQQACYTNGKLYAGVYNSGSNCVCTNTLPSTWTPTALPEGDCESSCLDDSSQQLCGSSSGSSAVSFFTSWSYLTAYKGCYNDSAITRDMTGGSLTSGTMTVARCLLFCSGYTYAGLEAGNSCYCGSTYNNEGVLPTTSCGTPCNGDPAQICGGSSPLALSVFSTANFVASDTGPTA